MIFPWGFPFELKQKTLGMRNFGHGFSNLNHYVHRRQSRSSRRRRRQSVEGRVGKSLLCGTPRDRCVVELVPLFLSAGFP